MKQLKKLYNKFYLYILSFFIVLFIFVLTLILCKINPFGNYTYIISDMQSQFYPFLFKYKSIIMNHEFLYNWNGGFGSPVYGLFFTYLSSPINIVILLFDNNHMELGIHLIMLIKLVLSSFSMIFYLSKKIKTNSIYLIIPAILYTFCGFFMRYFIFIQWLDMLYLLPLLTYGIEKFIDEHKLKLYIVILVLTIFTSIYIGYMLCIYTAIYFCIYNLLYTKGDSVVKKINNMSRNFLIILGATIIALLIVSPVLYSYYEVSQLFGNIGNGLPDMRYYDFSYFDYIHNHFIISNIKFGELNHNPPNIFCGILSLLLFIPFVFNKKIHIKDKVLYIGMLLVLLAFFRLPVLDFIINIFHIPNGAPYRYSFLYSFILCLILANSLIKWNTCKKELIISFVFNIVLFFIANKYTSIVNDKEYIVYILIVIYTLSLLFNKNNKIFLLLLVVLELSINMVLSFNRESNLLVIYNDSIVLSKTNYLTCTNNRNEVNNGYMYDVDFITYFSSTSSFNSSYLMYKNGMISEASRNVCHYNTPIIDSLFNIKYYKDSYNLIDDNYIKINNYLREYKYPLSKIYGVDNYIDFKDLGDKDIFTNQNKIAEAFTGVRDILVPVELKYNISYSDDSVVIYDYYFESDDNIYYYQDTSTNIFFAYKDNYIYAFLKPNSAYLKQLGLDDKQLIQNTNNFINMFNNSISIAYFKKDKIDHPVFYKVDKEKYENFYNYLSKHDSNITSLDTSGVKATIDLDKDMKIFTIIPYDKNWEVYVDDKLVDSYEVMDSLLGFEVSKGKHNIDIRYNPKKIKITLVISIVTIILSILYNIYRKVKCHE